jgi:hypothetical protein
MLRATAEEHALKLNEEQLESVIDATFDELPGCNGQPPRMSTDLRGWVRRVLGGGNTMRGPRGRA